MTTKPGRLKITAADLMKPSVMTCAQCGSRAVHVPKKQPKKFRDTYAWLAWMKEEAKAICPHCSPLPQEKWPIWQYGKVVKPCGCGGATCPVAAYAAALAS